MEWESLLAKYLENRTDETETLMVLDLLLKSEKERIIMDLAAAGLRCMLPDSSTLQK